MTVERAGGRVVAGDPVLVGIRRCADDDGVAPDKAVGGAAHSHLVRIRDSQGRDEPGGMDGVKGYHGIAGRAELCALPVDGDAWQETTGPLAARVGGGGEADVGAAATENA